MRHEDIGKVRCRAGRHVQCDGLVAVAEDVEFVNGLGAVDLFEEGDG